MIGILVEWIGGVLVIVFIIWAFYLVWIRFFWAGKRFQQEINKTVIQTGADIRCPIHGTMPAELAVPDTHNGITTMVCPICYKQYVEIPTFTIDTNPDD